MMSRFARSLAGSAVSTALAVAMAGAAQAQLAERPCRIVYNDASWGDVDPFTTSGEIRLGLRMPQPGGGFMIMGQGTATITYQTTGLRGGCSIIKGATKTVPVQAFVSSADGKKGEVDLLAGEFDHTVTFKCLSTPGEMSVDYIISVPPTVTIPLLHGASADYDDSGPRNGIRGKMEIEYCRTEPQ